MAGLLGRVALTEAEHAGEQLVNKVSQAAIQKAANYIGGLWSAYDVYNWTKPRTVTRPSSNMPVIRARRYRPRMARRRVYRVSRVYRKRTHPRIKYLRARKRARYRVGERPATSIAKKSSFVELHETINSRTMYEVPLTLLVKGDGINQRERDAVNLRGWKVNMEMINVGTKPRYFNYAVVTPKDCGTTTTSTLVIDFFRAYQANRAQNFSISLTGLQLHTLPINTDKINVLKHGRFKLGTDDPQAGFKDTRNYKTFSFFLPLGRQIRYDSSGNPTQKAWLVFWYDSVGAEANSAAEVEGLKLHYQIVTYFREPRV